MHNTLIALQKYLLQSSAQCQCEMYHCIYLLQCTLKSPILSCSVRSALLLSATSVVGFQNVGQCVVHGRQVKDWTFWSQ